MKMKTTRPPGLLDLEQTKTFLRLATRNVQGVYHEWDELLSPGLNGWMDKWLEAPSVITWDEKGIIYWKKNNSSVARPVVVASFQLSFIISATTWPTSIIDLNAELKARITVLEDATERTSERLKIFFNWLALQTMDPGLALAKQTNNQSEWNRCCWLAQVIFIDDDLVNSTIKLIQLELKRSFCQGSLLPAVAPRTRN